MRVDFISVQHQGANWRGGHDYLVKVVYEGNSRISNYVVPGDDLSNSVLSLVQTLGCREVRLGNVDPSNVNPVITERAQHLGAKVVSL